MRISTGIRVRIVQRTKLKRVPWLVCRSSEFQRRISGIERVVDFLQDEVFVVSVVSVSGESAVPFVSAISTNATRGSGCAHPSIANDAAVVAATSNIFQAVPGTS